MTEEASDLLVMSLGPEDLHLASNRDWNIELKLDWDNVGPDGEVGSDSDIVALLEQNDVDSEQLVDVHLPPGTSSSNPGMSVTRENIGNITDFSYNQLGSMSDVFMTTHPPKKFRYLDQLWVFHDLFQSMDREISIENTSAKSDWYTPEAAAFFGFVGKEYPNSFEDLFLTIDSAHLPQDDYVEQDFDRYYDPEDEDVRDLMARTDTDKEWLFEIDYDRVGDIVRQINEDLEGEDEIFPVRYLAYMGDNFRETVEEYFPENGGIITNNALTGDTYLPLLRTLSMTGERVRSVHLNDPDANDVPSMDNYRSSPALQASLDYLSDRDIYVVLEPEGDLDGETADNYMEEVRSMI